MLSRRRQRRKASYSVLFSPEEAGDEVAAPCGRLFLSREKSFRTDGRSLGPTLAAFPQGTYCAQREVEGTRQAVRGIFGSQSQEITKDLSVKS